jgi:hypothetical protein
MDRWLVTYRLPLSAEAITNRIEVEAASPLTAISAARRLLPESAEIVGYRLIEEVPPPVASRLKNPTRRLRRKTNLKTVLARIFFPFLK